MKLPKDAAEAVFTVGERKFALFLSFALVEVEDHDLQSGIMFRPGEVSCVTHTPEGIEPFDLTTAHLQPHLIDAESLEDAALTVSKQILAVGDRILAHQQAVASTPAPEGCCGGGDGCSHDAITREIDAEERQAQIDDEIAADITREIADEEAARDEAP